MNYLAEIKAFYDRLELNPQPNTAIALWHALMSIANKAGWPDTFTVASSVLGLRSGLNASALKRARNKLATDGFIEWKSRGGNLAAQYKINRFKITVKMNHSLNHKVNYKLHHSLNHKVNLLINKDININKIHPLYPPWNGMQSLPQSIRNGVLVVLLKQNTAMRYWLVYRKMIWYWPHRIMQIYADGRKQQSGILKSRRTFYERTCLCST